MKSTFETRLRLTDETDAILSEVAAYLSSVQRKLFSDLARGEKSKDLKSLYLKKYGLTARQFNAFRVSIEGKIASYKEIRKSQKETLKGKITSLENALSKRKASSLILHQKKRKLLNLKHKLTQLDNLSLCFGSKKKFREQFHLEEKSFERWKKEWQETRNNEFFCLGSKDEIDGNQTFTLTKGGRLRLPPFFEEKYGKYLYIPGVFFRYGQKQIEQALKAKRALSYRFKRDAKSWKLFASVDIDLPKIVTLKQKGAIGIDINEDHLAITEIDTYGNPIKSFRIESCFYGLNTTQVKAKIGEIAKEITLYAKQVKKPLVLEKLDFSKKKAQLKEGNCKYRRMLSSFSYSKLKEFIEVKALKEGVEVFFVNPAYTSVIGREKFSQRYGLTNHQSAALVIARRIYSFSDCLT